MMIQQKEHGFITYSHQIVFLSCAFGIVISLIGIVYVSICDLALSTLMLYDDHSHAFGFEIFTGNIEVFLLIIISGTVIAVVQYNCAPDGLHGGSFKPSLLSIDYEEAEESPVGGGGGGGQDTTMESPVDVEGQSLGTSDTCVERTDGGSEDQVVEESGSNTDTSSTVDFKSESVTAVGFQFIPITLALAGGFSVSSEVALTTLGTKLATVVMKYHGSVRGTERRLLLFAAFACSVLVYIPFPLLLVLMMYDSPAYHPGISTEDVTYNYMGVITSLSYTSFGVYFMYYCYLTGDYSFRSITSKLSFLSFELENSFVEQLLMSLGFGVVAAVFSVTVVVFLHLSMRTTIDVSKCVACQFGLRTQRELNLALSAVCVVTVGVFYVLCPLTIGSGWEIVDVLLTSAYSNRRFHSTDVNAVSEESTATTTEVENGAGVGIEAGSVTGDIERVSGSNHNTTQFMQYLVWGIICKVCTVGVSVLLVNTTMTAATATANGDAAKKQESPVGGGLLIPLFTIGMMLGCVFTSIFPSLPIGYCLCTCMVSVPAGVLTLLTDDIVSDWFISTISLTTESNQHQYQPLALMEGIKNIGMDSARSSNRRKTAFSQLTISLISIPLLVAFLGFRQTVPLYISLLTCYLTLRFVLDRNKRSDIPVGNSSSTTSKNTVITPSTSASTTIDSYDSIDSKSTLLDQYPSTSSMDTEDKGNNRFRLFSPLTINTLASTHVRFMLTLLIVGTIRLIITEGMGYL